MAAAPRTQLNFTDGTARSVSSLIWKNSRGLEAEERRQDVRRDLGDLRVEVAHDGVVVAAGVLHRLLDLRERRLELGEALDGAQLRIGLGEREELAEGGAQAPSASPLAAGLCADIAFDRASTTASSVPFSCAA